MNYDATAVIMYMPRCTERYQLQLRARKNHHRPHTYYIRKNPVTFITMRFPLSTSNWRGEANLRYMQISTLVRERDCSKESNTFKRTKEYMD